MRNTTTYEWNLPIIDDWGDIIDNQFNEKLSGFSQAEVDDADAVELIKNIGNEANGIEDRAYAHVRGGQLDTEFDDGCKVPVKLRDEFRKWQERQHRIFN